MTQPDNTRVENPAAPHHDDLVGDEPVWHARAERATGTPLGFPVPDDTKRRFAEGVARIKRAGRRSVPASSSVGGRDRTAASGQHPESIPDGRDQPGKARRILFTRSRTLGDADLVRYALRPLRAAGAVLVVGDAGGADRLATDAWRCWGLPVEVHRKDWKRDGRAAGFRRDERMVAAAADACVALIHNNSRGATQCAQRAEEASITTYRIFIAPPEGPSLPTGVHTADITMSIARADHDTDATATGPAGTPSPSDAAMSAPGTAGREDGAAIADTIGRAGLGHPHPAADHSAALTPPVDAAGSSAGIEHVTQGGLEAW